MDRAQKAQTISSLGQNLQSAGGLVLVHNLGLNAADIGDLRKKVRGANGLFKVAKNRLIARALEGTQFKALDDKLTGPTALVYGEDFFAISKTIVNFAKGNEKLKVIGGAMGSEIFDAKGVEAMAKMPSLNELRATIVGLLQAPASKMARVLNAYATKESGEQPTA